MNPSSEPLSSDTQTEEKPKARRRRLRWSMRGFFIAVTLLCLVFGLVGRHLYVGMVHADVGRQLTLRAERIPIRYGFPNQDKVHIGWTIPNRPAGRIDWGHDNNFPTWMKWTYSDVLFRRLDKVLISNDASDDDLEFTFQQIHRLGKLHELLIRRKLSSDKLDRLLSPLQIQKLAIYPQAEQDESYDFLHRIGVKDLEIHRAPVATLEDLPISLRRLDISGPDIDDESLAGLARLKNLQQLDLTGTLATESGVEKLRRQMPWCEITWAKRIWWNGKRIEETPSP